MNYKFLILLFLMILFNCKQSEKVINVKNESKYIFVSMEKLIQNSNYYNNKHVEIEGFFDFKMEESSISIKEKSSYNEKIWLEFNFFKELKNQKGKLFFKDDHLLKYLGKKVRVRGVYNIDYKGHLAWYNGSLNVKEFAHKDERYIPNDDPIPTKMER